MVAYGADCEFELGRIEESERRDRRALELGQQIDDRQSLIYTLAHMARNAAFRGDADRAGRLWGALEAEAERAPVGQWEAEREKYAEAFLRSTDRSSSAHVKRVAGCRSKPRSSRRARAWTKARAAASGRVGRL